jgi:hypothetical protein
VQRDATAHCAVAKTVHRARDTHHTYEIPIRRAHAASRIFTASSAICMRISRRLPMMDVILLALGIALFAISVAYTYACERL